MVDVIKAKTLHELKEEVDALREQLTELREWAAKAAPVIAGIRDMAVVFGNYRGNDNRVLPAVITAAWQNRGVVDVIIFDNGHSGGLRELTDKEIGTDKDQFQPYYLEPDNEEVPNDNLVAAQS